MRLLQIVSKSADAELVADRLWQAGARAVEEVVLADGRAAARSVLADDDATSLGRLGPLPADWTVEWVEVDDEPANTWRRYVGAVEVGDRHSPTAGSRSRSNPRDRSASAITRRRG